MREKPTLFEKKKKVKHVKIVAPPPLPNTTTHILVKKKDGSYFWRARRGTHITATLNPTLAAMAKYKKRSMAAATRLITVLNPFTCNRKEGYKYDIYSRNAQRFAGLFSFSIMKDDKMGWSFFGGRELNPNCTLEKLIGTIQKPVVKNNTATLKFQLQDNMVNKLRNNAATHFYFELILISGDPAKTNSLRSEHDISPDYPYMSHSHFNKDGKKQYCDLSVVIPDKKPYLLILKAATRDGSFSSGAKYEGLRVVGWG